MFGHIINVSNATFLLHFIIIYINMYFYFVKCTSTFIICLTIYVYPTVGIVQYIYSILQIGLIAIEPLILAIAIVNRKK